MFDDLESVSSLVKNITRIREALARLDKEAASNCYEGCSAGDSTVMVTVNGRGELIGIKIVPEAVTDVERLETLIADAIQRASTEARKGLAEKRAQILGGLDIPGLEHLLIS